MGSSDKARDHTSPDAVTGMVRFLCQVRLVVLAFALVLEYLGGFAWFGVLLVMLAAPFSFVPALNWRSRGPVYARNGILLAADVLVAAIVIVALAGSPLMAVYAAATGALWGLFAGVRLALVMTTPLCLILLQWSVPDGGLRGLVTGLAAAGLTVAMAAAGTTLGNTLRAQAQAATDLAAAREREAATAERLRLARDLHDTLAGDLAGIAMATGELGDRLAREDSVRPTLELARSVDAAVRVAHRHTRLALGELREVPMGLARALPALVAAWTERTSIPVDLDLAPDLDTVAGAGRAGHLRAVVGELLENVRKHAGATRVDVTVTTDNHEIAVVVTDDGNGIGPRRADQDAFGLRGIRERAGLCGGHADWQPGPNGGTVASVHLPAEPQTVVGPDASARADAVGHQEMEVA